MKPAARLALLLALGAAIGAGWTLVRRGARRPERPAAEAAIPVAQQAERQPVEPAPPLAAPIPEPAGPAAPDWVELNNEATTDLTLGDLVGAVTKLERCHAAEPDDPVFANNLAEALVRLAKAEHEHGDLQEALAHLERAILVGRAREDLETLRRILARWQSELELGRDDWTEGSSRFELSFDTDRSDLLHHSHEVLEHLERSFDELVRWFGEDPFRGAAPIRVLLYDPEDFDRLTGLGDWAAGVFDGAVRVSVRDVTGGAGWREVLVHELVHAFVQALAGAGVPGWLNEGLAQVLEGRPGEAARMRARLGTAELFPLEALQGTLAGWEDRDAIARAYAQSFLFVAYLRATYGDESLRRTLLGIRRGLAPAAAFEEWSAVALGIAFQDWSAGLLGR